MFGVPDSCVIIGSFYSNMKIIVILLSYIFSGVSPTEVDQGINIDYYWRDYTGEIPSDAVPGGLDLNNETTYIGQGFVGNVGNLPGIIYPGRVELSVPEHGVVKVDRYIKILCSPYKKAFRWLPVTAKDFQIMTTGKYLVVGGIARNNFLNIGRIAFQGEILTGKVVTNSPDYSNIVPMFFVFKNQEYEITTYEVLVYDTYY